ncbi:MAG TPA: SDR family NAD(P)-dependent oxidoreductase [Alphaproteobacteria bacterium]|jgi:NAD(P)-dependent dehydrogenase (short-subunit alcohol dehydrogenase family)
MPKRLQDRIAIVTGAGSSGPGWGNGKAAAVLFAREGAKVLCSDINEAAARETADIIEKEGGAAEVFACDVSKSDQVAAMVARCRAAFGGRIDILHNNVGIAVTGGPVDLSEADWDRVSAINIKSMFLTCKYVLPVMVAQTPNQYGLRGAIVNISSVAGIRWSGVSYLAYSTTKGAALPFTRSVALEYAKQGIRANAILPGLMNTPMVRGAAIQNSYGGNEAEMVRRRDAQCPMGKMGDAWDVAYAALFLASDEAKYITGAELIVDGGLTCKVA